MHTHARSLARAPTTVHRSVTRTRSRRNAVTRHDDGGRTIYFTSGIRTTSMTAKTSIRQWLRQPLDGSIGPIISNLPSHSPNKRCRWRLCRERGWHCTLKYKTSKQKRIIFSKIMLKCCRAKIKICLTPLLRFTSSSSFCLSLRASVRKNISIQRSISGTQLTGDRLYPACLGAYQSIPWPSANQKINGMHSGEKEVAVRVML